jgi:hypothetical protein
MEKTRTVAEQTLQDVREGVSAGMDHSRDRAADVLERAGGAVRSGSQKAGRAAQRGDQIGRSMEQRADDLRPQRRGVFGYLRRHPVQTLLLLGLITGVVAVAFIPRLAARGDKGHGSFEIGPMA